MKKKLIIFILCLFIQGCVTSSTTLKLNPQALTDQKAVASGGLNAVVSEKKVRVIAAPLKDTYSSEDHLTFVFSVYSADEPFDLSTKDIQVLVDGKPHKILTYDELVADLKEQRKVLIRKARMNKDAKYEASGGSGALQNAANREMDEEIAKIEKNTKAAMNSLNSTTLRDTKVMPDTQCSFNITLEKIPDPAKAKEIKLIVTVAGEKHEFLINMAII